jgi:hypothetical protein
MSNGAGTDFSRCVAAAMSEVLGERAPAATPLEPPTIDRTRFVDFVGRYVERAGFIGAAEISMDPSGDLRISIPAADAAGIPYEPLLVPYGDDLFALVLPEEALGLRGFRGEGAAIEHLRNRQFVLTRAPAQAPFQRPDRPDRRDRAALERALRPARPIGP